MEKKKDSTDSRRITYRLTEKGRDLYPVTLALLQWGDRWMSDEKGPPLILQHKKCGHQMKPVMCCNQCGEAIHVHEMTYQEKWREKEWNAKKPVMER